MTDSDRRAETHRPGLERLSNEWQDVRGRLLEGFDSNEEIVLWLVDLNAVTAGEIPARFLRLATVDVPLWQGTDLDPFAEAEVMGPSDLSPDPDVEKDPVLTEVLLGRETATKADPPLSWRPSDEWGPEEYRRLREGLAARLHGHYTEAVERLRWNFTEYGENPPNVDRSEDVALRPAWQELWDTQRSVIRRWLRGFESAEEQLDWADDLVEATLGEHAKDFPEVAFETEPFFAEATRRDSPYTAENPREAAGARGWAASWVILPWFKQAMYQQTSRASEQMVDAGDDELPEYELGAADLLGVGEDAGDGGR